MDKGSITETVDPIHIPVGKTKYYKDWYSQHFCLTLSSAQEILKPLPSVAARLDDQKILLQFLIKATW